jgi:hypothetical protein
MWRSNIQRMNGYFDIVMFDEASQLRLEDNLPAILKGKQIVIAEMNIKCHLQIILARYSMELLKMKMI